MQEFSVIPYGPALLILSQLIPVLFLDAVHHAFTITLIAIVRSEFITEWAARSVTVRTFNVLLAVTGKACFLERVRFRITQDPFLERVVSRLT